MSTPEELPRKRAAFESPADLARPLARDPEMRRPISTVAGSVLVLLRAATGILILAVLAFDWPEIIDGSDVTFEGVSLTGAELSFAVGVVLFGGGLIFVAEAMLGFMILRGWNGPRVIVLVFSVASISTSFAGWWFNGQEIAVTGTLPSVALDILILLALSSRSSAAFARRNEKRPDTT
ncbi:hypothetical protein FHX49_001335 [Microbacterium endophyticum]|uniref:Uncharacterized protein n=1 Tax=Microbacterium endophyticum TaxID=1526412 RepID=A0A7W4V403_9MICO|nr:hypothetical protein [Microbacterium endophyticum]MBB2975768.1 hypothetical protein [Microbacterium endophyticum]NIK36251.1 hypothetical protein [Microbacterium endophyticum]